MVWPFNRRNLRTAGSLFAATVAPPIALPAPPEIRFTFKLFRELARKDPSANIFFSPCSVMLCLAMVCDGASGETRDGMAKALELSGLDAKGLEDAIAGLRSVLAAQGSGVQLLISNSLWCSQSIPVDAAFTARVHDIYDAEVHEIDFGAQDASARINSWVSEKTARMIPQIADGFNPLTLLVALNAIYFKGGWSEPFHRVFTREEPFTTGDGHRKPVPTMRQSGKFRYSEQAEFQAVVLPYAGKRISMYVLLPARESNLQRLRDALGAGEWQVLTKKFDETKGSVLFPRFKVNYSAALRGALTNLGMERAFDHERAEFAGIRKPPPLVWIDEVLHKAVAEVNEEGTEAAAATMSEMFGASMERSRPEPHFEMVVDRPFLFLIRDESSGNILFMGSVVDPTT